MTISNISKKAVTILEHANIQSPNTDAAVLLCFCLNCPRTYIHTYPEKEISDKLKARYLKLVRQRAQHTPLQHLTNTQEFMSLVFFVDQNVLIPRQDTETLVESIIKELKSSNTKTSKSILELGTGSGCISISIAKYIDKTKITATDISKEALDIAKKNAKLNQVKEKIEFIQSDLFENIHLQKFDIILSNPPYIPSNDILNLSPEVSKNEPIQALDGGLDGLNFYRAIISNATKHLLPNGLLSFECGINQAEIIKVLMQENFKDVDIINDLSNIPRVVHGKLKP